MKTRAEYTFEKLANIDGTEAAIAAGLGAGGAGAGAMAYLKGQEAQRAKDLATYTRSRGYAGLLGKLFTDKSGKDLGLSLGQRFGTYLGGDLGSAMGNAVGSAATGNPLGAVLGTLGGRAATTEAMAAARGGNNSKALQTLAGRYKGLGAGLGALGAGTLAYGALND